MPYSKRERNEAERRYQCQLERQSDRQLRRELLRLEMEIRYTRDCRERAEIQIQIDVIKKILAQRRWEASFPDSRY
jgi:hypothetical protein